MRNCRRLGVLARPRHRRGNIRSGDGSPEQAANKGEIGVTGNIQQLTSRGWRGAKTAMLRRRAYRAGRVQLAKDLSQLPDVVLLAQGDGGGRNGHLDANHKGRLAKIFEFVHLAHGGGKVIDDFAVGCHVQNVVDHDGER